MNSVQTRPDVALDPFGMILSEADRIEYEAWLDKVDAGRVDDMADWADAQEAEAAARE